MLTRILIGTALVLTAPGGQAANWKVANEPVPYSVEPSIPVAVIENEEGNSLRVYIDDHGTVRGILSLHRGFTVFAASTCPTYNVDDQAPRILSMGEGPCELEGRRVHFALGNQKGGQIHSNQLAQIMNGKRIFFRYPLESVGYGETSFSLRRSKHALHGAVGDNIKIVED